MVPEGQAGHNYVEPSVPDCRSGPEKSLLFRSDHKLVFARSLLKFVSERRNSALSKR